MKFTIDQQIELMTAIIISGEVSEHWKHSLQMAMYAIESSNQKEE